MLGRRLVRKPCQYMRRKLSSTPPSSSSSTQPGGLRGAPSPSKSSSKSSSSNGPGGTNPEGGGGGSGLVTAFVFATLAGTVFASYKLETDEHFEKSTHKFFPGVVGLLSPVGGILRTLGVVNTKKPTDLPNNSATVVKNEINVTPTEITKVKQNEEIVVSANIMDEESKDKSKGGDYDGNVVVKEIEEKNDAEQQQPEQVEEEGEQQSDQPVPHAPSPLKRMENAIEEVEHKLEEAVEPLFHKKDIKHEDVAVAEKVAKPYINAIPVIDYTKVAAVPAELKAAEMKHDVATVLMEELNEQTAAFRKELEASLMKDLEHMNEDQLRIRITQLASEFFERTKWEGIRLHQSLRTLEADLSKRYIDLLAEQRSQLEAELIKAIYSKEKDLSVEFDRKLHTIQGNFELQLREALKSQADVFSRNLSQQLEGQKADILQQAEEDANIQVAQIKRDTATKLLEHQNTVSKVETQLADINKVIDSRETLRMLSNSLHKQSAALLAFENALVSSSPLKKEITAMKEACNDDPLFTSVLSSLRSEALTDGIPTLPELRLRFKVVRNEVRKVALAPEAAPKLVGQIVGNVLAAVSFAPKGYVKGEGVEEALARATYLLEQEDLQGAVKEISNLDGYAKKLVADWKQSANDRLNAEEAVKVLRAGTAVRHLSLVDK